MSHQSPFQHINAKAYLAFCAVAPMSGVVAEGISEICQHYRENGVKEYSFINERMAHFFATCTRLFGGSVNDYSMTPNTSFAINQIAHAVDWHENDRILLFEGEFPTNVRPWLNAAKTYRLKVETLPVSTKRDCQGINLDEVEERLKSGVRLVAISAVQFQTGRRMPIEELAVLCKKHGALIFVDAIQLAGTSPVDFSEFDFWAAGGHKWLCGPEGTGLLYSHPEIRPFLKPKFVGWLSMENPYNFLFEGHGLLDYHRNLSETGSRFELGCHNRIGFWGLASALNLIESVGLPTIYGRIQTYHDKAEALFSDAGIPSCRANDLQMRSGILSFRLDVAPSIVVSHFAKHDITVTMPDGYLRIAPHFWNQDTQLACLAEAVDDLATSFL